MATLMWINDRPAEQLGLRVRAPRAWADVPARRYVTLSVPGLAGHILAPTVLSEPRELQVEGFFRTADRSAILAALAGRLEIRFVDQPDRVQDAWLTDGTVRLLEDTLALQTQFPRVLTLSLLCPRPAWRDRYRQVLAFGAARTPVPLGDVATTGVTIIGGPVAASGFDIVLRAGTGEEVAVMTVHTPLAADEHVRIDHALKTVHVSTPSGDVADLDLVSGSFLTLDPLDGAVTVEVTAGSGVLYYYRLWS